MNGTPSPTGAQFQGGSVGNAEVQGAGRLAWRAGVRQGMLEMQQLKGANSACSSPSQHWPACHLPESGPIALPCPFPSPHVQVGRSSYHTWARRLPLPGVGGSRRGLRTQVVARASGGPQVWCQEWLGLGNWAVFTCLCSQPLHG